MKLSQIKQIIKHELINLREAKKKTHSTQDDAPKENMKKITADMVGKPLCCYLKGGCGRCVWCCK